MRAMLANKAALYRELQLEKFKQIAQFPVQEPVDYNFARCVVLE